MSGDLSRLNAAFAAIDAANAEDPGAKEPRDAELAVEWVRRLRGDDAPEELLLAARAHHVRRWEIPRSTYPDGRAGYLKWKTDLQKHHAAVVEPLLREAGYDDGAVARVQHIVRKRGLAGGADPDVQTLEDALCIVFLQTQFADLAARLAPDKMVEILRKSLAKMSDEGRRAALALAPALSPDEQGLLQAALAR